MILTGHRNQEIHRRASETSLTGTGKKEKESAVETRQKDTTHGPQLICHECDITKLPCHYHKTVCA